VAERILVVDDEVAMAGVVASYLEREGFEVALAHNGPDAVVLAESLDPAVIVLDIRMEGMSGPELFNLLRERGSTLPVIFLTSKDEEIDQLFGLKMGADDYVVKPFSPRELVARVHAMMRRPRINRDDTAGESVLQVGGLQLDTHARRVLVDGTPVELTRTEFDLVAAMAARPRMAFSRRQLIDEVWGPGWYGDEHVVDVHVGHLRTKLGDPANEPRFIRTVRGVGYGMGNG